MRQRLRSSLTYANVMVTILAFVVLGGGTAFAAFVVSSINGTDVEDLVFHQLTILGPGWSGGCFNTGAPSVAKSVQKVVHLRGGMCRSTGTSNLLFTLPTFYQPTKREYLTVDQFNGATGRIVVNPNGTVFVVSDPEHPTAAAQFTSLAGVSYTLPR